jgi:hypothetical protein
MTYLGRIALDVPWNELLFCFVTFLFPFLLGMVLFSKWIFRDVEVRWGVGFASQLVFACTLSVAFQTHIAVLGEVSGVLTRSTREQIWVFDLTCWVILLKVIIPFFVFMAIIFKYSKQLSLTLKVVATLILESIWLLILSWGNGVSHLNLQSETERLGLIGLVSVAILSGWGAVHGPYNYGPWFIKQYNDDEIVRVEQKLWSVLEMQSSIKRRIALAKSVNSTAVPAATSPRLSRTPSSNPLAMLGQIWARRNNSQPSLVLGSDPQVQADRDEADTLALLSLELFLELTEMKRAKQQTLFRKTLLGHIYTFLGYTFALYCIVKMCVSLYGMIYPKGPTDPDLITNVLSFVLIFARSRDEANALAQTISFVMVGVLVFNSFRGLLVALGRIFHQMLGPTSRDSSLVSLLLTEIMGQYLLSSIILLDLNVPFKYRGGDRFFSQKFEMFRLYFDMFFFLSGIVSFVFIYALDQARGSRTEFYHTTAHEKII